jgi:hypothetical protein
MHLVLYDLLQRFYLSNAASIIGSFTALQTSMYDVCSAVCVDRSKKGCKHHWMCYDFVDLVLFN